MLMVLPDKHVWQYNSQLFVTIMKYPRQATSLKKVGSLFWCLVLEAQSPEATASTGACKGALWLHPDMAGPHVSLWFVSLSWMLCPNDLINLTTLQKLNRY